MVGIRSDVAFTVVASGFGALEGPVVAADGSLLVADLKWGVVWSVRRDGATSVVLERASVGGMCLHADGGLVLSGRSVVHVLGERERTLLDLDDVAVRPGRHAVGFNDLTADPDGRVIVGVLRQDGRGQPMPGELVMLSAPHDGTVIHDDIHPNGLAFSADGQRLFAADTFGQRVVTFTTAANGPPQVTGEISTASVSGMPDGLTSDISGGVWVACYRGAAVVRLDTGGDSIDQIPVPASKPLSVCFDGDDLYVVTGSDDEQGETGAVLLAECVATGSPVHVARL